MKYCALLSSNFCGVSSTCHIYHRAAKRRGDKFDRSMTRGKLLDNDTQLFIFISILIMTKLHPRDPENRQQNRFSERRFSKKKPSYNRLNGKAWLGLITTSYDLSGNNAEFVSVDLIGENNQFILEYGIKNWKELPRNIKECKRKDVFKTLVKQHLLDKGLQNSF